MLQFREQIKERDLCHEKLDKLLQIHLVGQESMQDCKIWKIILSLFRRTFIKRYFNTVSDIKKSLAATKELKL